MGTDDLFKKRRQQREQRKHEFKSPKANSFLIRMILRILMKLLMMLFPRATRLHGAISHLNIGFICISIIVMLHFTEMYGMKS